MQRNCTCINFDIFARSCPKIDTHAPLKIHYVYLSPTLNAFIFDAHGLLVAAQQNLFFTKCILLDGRLHILFLCVFFFFSFHHFLLDNKKCALYVRRFWAIADYIVCEKQFQLNVYISSVPFSKVLSSSKEMHLAYAHSRSMAPSISSASYFS